MIEYCWILKSNFFGPGAIAESNEVRIHFTCALVYPSFFATAYAPAAAKPLPDSGLSSITQGVYAGAPVAIVKVCAVTVFRAIGVQAVEAADALVNEPVREVSANPSAAIGARRVVFFIDVVPFLDPVRDLRLSKQFALDRVFTQSTPPRWRVANQLAEA